jgi:hypothetical protein
VGVTTFEVKEFDYLRMFTSRHLLSFSALLDFMRPQRAYRSTFRQALSTALQPAPVSCSSSIFETWDQTCGTKWGALQTLRKALSTAFPLSGSSRSRDIRSDHLCGIIWKVVIELPAVPRILHHHRACQRSGLIAVFAPFLRNQCVCELHLLSETFFVSPY